MDEILFSSYRIVFVLTILSMRRAITGPFSRALTTAYSTTYKPQFERVGVSSSARYFSTNSEIKFPTPDAPEKTHRKSQTSEIGSRIKIYAICKSVGLNPERVKIVVVPEAKLPALSPMPETDDMLSLSIPSSYLSNGNSATAAPSKLEPWSENERRAIIAQLVGRQRVESNIPRVSDFWAKYTARLGVANFARLCLKIFSQPKNDTRTAVLEGDRFAFNCGDGPGLANWLRRNVNEPELATDGMPTVAERLTALNAYNSNDVLARNPVRPSI